MRNSGRGSLPHHPGPEDDGLKAGDSILQDKEKD